MVREIYLDNNATTKVNADVLAYQNEIMKDYFGNASSQYPLGQNSKRVIEESRAIIKETIHAGQKDTIVFSGCASESNNSVFFSAINSFPEKKHIIISAVEHLSVLSTAMFWKGKGYEVTVIDVDHNGNLNLDKYKKSIRKDTLLISIMTANNETGVIFPIKQLVQIAREITPDVLFHTDAVQAMGKIPVDVTDIGVDYLSISGHKFHAPKGVGVLYIRSNSPYVPFIYGGHQESNLRAGTENIALIAAIGRAASYIDGLIVENAKRRILRDWMEAEIGKLDDIMVFGQNVERLPNTSNISVKNIDGINILLHLASKGIYVSTGSACNSMNMEPSHVLAAMRAPGEYAHSIRISLSSETTGEDVRSFVNEFISIVNHLRRK